MYTVDEDTITARPGCMIEIQNHITRRCTYNDIPSRERCFHQTAYDIVFMRLGGRSSELNHLGGCSTNSIVMSAAVTIITSIRLVIVMYIVSGKK